MAIASAFSVPHDLPPIDLVRLFGGQEWIFRIVPVPEPGVRFAFAFADGHQFSIAWPNTLRRAAHYIARIVILPLDGELIDARSWRIYVDVNGQHIGTLVSPTHFSARTGSFNTCNVVSDEPVQSARLIEFYREGSAGRELSDFFAVSAHGLFEKPTDPA